MTGAGPREPSNYELGITLGRIETKIDDGLKAVVKTGDDHEVRIRELERPWRAHAASVGALAALASAVATVWAYTSR